MSESIRVIDVSNLPAHTLDHRSPIWWGNTLLLVIESAMFGILIASYFYLRRNFDVWPPPRTTGYPVDLHPLPDLTLATVNLGVIVLGCIPMLIADRAALRRDRKWVDIGLVAAVLVGLLTIALRWREFSALRMSWDENAYASVSWTILGMHFMHLIVGTAETVLMTAWLLTHGLDDQHARDVRVTASYWYWIAAVWIPLYVLVYFGPRIL